MKNSNHKFLEFNGKSIYFLNRDGQYWVAIKPICEALNVNYNRQFQNIKEDPILSKLFAVQQMVDRVESLRKMAALPEKYIYGWLFSIKSKSEELLAYKMECYNVLYEHFHGSITQLSKRLQKKQLHKSKELELRDQLRQNPLFIQYEEAQKQVKKANDEINSTKTEIVNQQLTLFSN